MIETILSSVSHSYSQNLDATPVQSRVDQTLSALKEQFTDPCFVAASLVGAVAFGGIRWGAARRSNAILEEVNALKEAAREHLKWVSKNSEPIRAFRMLGGRQIILGEGELTLMARSLRAVSLPLGIFAGATVHEMTHRSFLALAGRGSENPDLFKWEGENGFKNGWIRSLTGIGPSFYAGELGGRLGNSLLLTGPKPLRMSVIGIAALLPFLACYAALDRSKH
jgi:hypothetical protein